MALNITIETGNDAFTGSLAPIELIRLLDKIGDRIDSGAICADGDEVPVFDINGGRCGKVVWTED